MSSTGKTLLVSMMIALVPVAALAAKPRVSLIPENIWSAMENESKRIECLKTECRDFQMDTTYDSSSNREFPVTSADRANGITRKWCAHYSFLKKTGPRKTWEQWSGVTAVVLQNGQYYHYGEMEEFMFTAGCR